MTRADGHPAGPVPQIPAGGGPGSRPPAPSALPAPSAPLTVSAGGPQPSTPAAPGGNLPLAAVPLPTPAPAPAPDPVPVPVAPAVVAAGAGQLALAVPSPVLGAGPSGGGLPGLGAGDVAWLVPLTTGERWLLAGIPLLWLLSLLRWLAGERVHVLQELSWVFAFSLSALAPAFVKARRAALGGLLERFATNEPAFLERYRAYIGRWEAGWRAEVIGIVGGVTFALMRHYVTSTNITYVFENTKLAALIIGTVGFTLFARSIALFLAFGALVSRLGEDLEAASERMFSWEVIAASGRGYARTALGASGLALATFWMALSTQLLVTVPPLPLAHQVVLVVCLFALSLAVPLIYLVLPLWRLHSILVARKARIRELFAARRFALEQQVLATPSPELLQDYLLQRQLLAEIDGLPEWPFRFDTVAQILGVVSVPLAIFLVRDVVGVWLLEWLKRPDLI